MFNEGSKVMQWNVVRVVTFMDNCVLSNMSHRPYHQIISNYPQT
jgi:hypothetical protein